MSRCHMCDYSEDVPSLYRQHLAETSKKTRVQMDPKTGKSICTDCITVINDDLLDQERS